MDSRRGLELWGPAGRWLFLNWPRGSWQYDVICGLVIAGLFVLPGPTGSARQVEATPARDVEAVLAAIESSEAAIESFQARMIESQHYALFDQVDTATGTLSFLVPDYVRRDIAEPAPRTEVLANGEATIWIPRINKVDIYPLRSAEGQELVIPGLASASRLREEYDVRLAEVLESADVAARSAAGAAPPLPAPSSGSRIYVLGLTPQPDTESAKHWQRIELWVEEGHWHPARRIVLVEHNGDTRTLDLLEIDRDADLGPKDFDVDYPAGAEVIRHQGIGAPRPSRVASR